MIDRRAYAGSAVLFIELEVSNTAFLLNWHAGPAPFDFETTSAYEDDRDPESSARYLSKRVHQALYAPGSRHWIRRDRAIVELLPLPQQDGLAGRATHIAVVHVGLVECFSVEDLVVQLEPATSEALSGLPVGHRGRSFHLVGLLHLDPGILAQGRRPDSDYDQERALVAWQVSTLRPGDDPPQGELERLAAGRQLLEPTADMTLVVHHDGASLVLSDEPESDSETPFQAWLEDTVPEPSVSAQVQWHLHTTITDAVLLGLLQRTGLNALADRVAQAAAATPDVKTMVALQTAFARFKGSFWWRHVSEEETVNLVSKAIRERHGLDELFEEVNEALSQYSEHVQGISVALSSAAVTILTLTLFPLTVMVALITAITPASASLGLKLVAYLSSVPLSLGVGLCVAAFIPGYLRFLRSTFQSRSE